MAKGIKIDGYVFHQKEQVLDMNEFLDAFIEFVESKGWEFGGTTKPFDENEEEI
jgi:uncharacterized protein YggL (DUF469 family)